MTDRRPDLWGHVHAERRRLLTCLAQVTPEQWRRPTLCDRWDVEEVTAHLVAAARTGTLAWLTNMVAARFDTDRHNARLVARHRGSTPAETLARFGEVVDLSIAPTKDVAAFLGEVIVHGQDITVPLGLELRPDPSAVLAVADFYARRDFAVHSATLVAGVRLDATDVDFAHGAGPVVTGPLLNLVMVMAGRGLFLDGLSGPGTDVLRVRLDQPAG